MVKIFAPLTYAGAIPFIFCALCYLLAIRQIPVLGDVDQILSIYGLVIASFLIGSHWGLQFSLKQSWRVYLPVVSNILAVLLWGAYLVAGFKPFIFTLALVFTVLLKIDWGLYTLGVISPDYFRTRIVITVVVVTTLILSMVLA